MHEGIAATRALRPTFLPYLLDALADGYVKAGRLGDALDVITEALTTGERTGERFYECFRTAQRRLAEPDRGRRL